MRVQGLMLIAFWMSMITHISQATPIKSLLGQLPIARQRETISPIKNHLVLPKRGETVANLGNGWAAYYQTFGTLLPIQLATSILANFYSHIIDSIQSSRTLSLGDAGPFQAFEWEGIRLEFSSDGHRIPWEFMATFAARMAALTQRGFTGQFNAVYVHMATEQSIRISLIVLQNALGN